MELKLEKNIDWEPLSIRLIASNSQISDVEAIRAAVDEWATRRTSKPVCGNDCYTKYVDVSKTGEGFRISIEWACKECFTSLLEYVGSRFPHIQRAVIGTPPETRGPIPPPGPPAFVTV